MSIFTALIGRSISCEFIEYFRSQARLSLVAGGALAPGNVAFDTNDLIGKIFLDKGCFPVSIHSRTLQQNNFGFIS